MSTNEITGDKMVSKPTTDAYAEGHDRIFGGVKLPSERECCGTFPGTPHRITCSKWRGKKPEAKLPPRATLARFIEKQMNEDAKPLGTCHHYGRQELYALMDFLYGEAPVNPEDALFYVSPEEIAANKKQMDEFIRENLRIRDAATARGSEALRKIQEGEL